MMSRRARSCRWSPGPTTGRPTGEATCFDLRRSWGRVAGDLSLDPALLELDLWPPPRSRRDARSTRPRLRLRLAVRSTHRAARPRAARVRHDRPPRPAGRARARAQPPGADLLGRPVERL